jgi:hypothetical protein
MMPNNRGVNSFDPPANMIRNGTIVGYDPITNTLQVRLTENSSLKGKPIPVSVPAYFPLSDSNGAFIGTLPVKGTTVTLSQAAGGQFYIVNHQQESLNNIPDLTLGEMLLYTTETSFVSLDMDSHIYAGSDTNNIHIFAGSQQYPKTNFITLNFENENHFNQAYREIGGLVKRDLRPNPLAASYDGSSKLADDSYDIFYSLIGLDPTATANDLPIGPTKNPPLVEHRQIVYEFQYQSDVESDAIESNKYTSNPPTSPTYVTQNRRASRADTMSLSLVEPNFLMEEVKGTVVDIFGNILDLNRGGLPVGLSASTTLRTTGTTASTNAQQSYLNIRALERKSIAYHLEINARKDPAPTFPGVTQIDLSINADNYNAKLLRSRFSLDVDKEGQFKLNVPASSNVGNIPLLVRPENYSTFATTDSGNPNQTWFTPSPNNTGQDIYVDSFAAPMTTINNTGVPTFTNSFNHGSIKLIDGDTGADQGPVDRISQFVDNNPFNIRHGTVFHDILQTCYLTRDSTEVLSFPTGGVNNVPVTYLSTDMATNAAVASPQIIVTGAGANAGGRSGSINFDGSIEMNVGANTIDRQSLWLDTAGGAVVNLGRDTQQRSLVMGMDGHAFIQIGGYGISGDARFDALGQDGLVNGILDLRIYSGGFVHMIRIDSLGMVLMSPGRVGIHAGQGLTLSSDGDMVIDCETLTVQQRGVKKVFGGSL